MLLQELFKDTYDWEWVKDTRFLNIAVFTTDQGLEYEISMTPRDDPKQINSFNMDFQKNLTKFDKVWHVEFSISNMKNPHGEAIQGISGTGDQFKVFSTIKSILEEFIRIKNVDFLYFTAFEESRVKLYKRMMQKFFKDYQVSGTGKFLVEV